MYPTIQDLVMDSVVHYPSLYHCKKFNDTVLNVLDHYFLTLGNGVDMELCEDGLYRFLIKPPAYEYRKKNVLITTRDSYKERIMAGEPIAILSKESVNWNGNFFMTEAIHSGISTIDFLKDVENPEKYLSWPVMSGSHKLPKGTKEVFCKEVFPDKNLDGEDRSFYPYTHFGFFYLPFIRILPAYKKKNISRWAEKDYRIITHEDISELKHLVTADYLRNIRMLLQATRSYIGKRINNQDLLGMNDSLEYFKTQHSKIVHILQGLALIPDHYYCPDIYETIQKEN